MSIYTSDLFSLSREQYDKEEKQGYYRKSYRYYRLKSVPKGYWVPLYTKLVHNLYDDKLPVFSYLWSRRPTPPSPGELIVEGYLNNGMYKAQAVKVIERHSGGTCAIIYVESLRPTHCQNYYWEWG